MLRSRPCRPRWPKRWCGHGLRFAGEAGLDIAAAEGQIRSPDVVAFLNQDRDDVEAVGVRQTPTFFVNRRLLDPFGETELRALVTDETRTR